MWGCNNLGLMYQRGQGVARDASEALRLYRKACDASQMVACDNAGYMYLNGRGASKDEGEAVHMFRTLQRRLFGWDVSNSASCWRADRRDEE